MEAAKTALLADAEATVQRLRGWRDECRTGGQVGVRTRMYVQRF